MTKLLVERKLLKSKIDCSEPNSSTVSTFINFAGKRLHFVYKICLARRVTKPISWSNGTTSIVF